MPEATNKRRVLVCMCLALLACSGKSGEPRHAGEAVEVVVDGTETGGEERGAGRLAGEAPVEEAGPKVKFELFVMSMCPYAAGVQKSMYEVVQKMGEHIDFEQHFIASKKEDGSISCLHGEPECQGNIVELCAALHAPDHLPALAACMAEDFKDIPGNWKACGSKIGMDTGPVETCATHGQGAKLLEESLEISKSAGAHGSPTIFIDGERYKGGRSAKAFEHAICQAFDEDERPASCPEFPEVKLTVISDERSSECQDRAQGLIKQFEVMFTSLEVELLDWSNPEAKELAKKTSVKYLPAFIFHPGVEEGLGWELVENHVAGQAGYWVVKADNVHSTHDPTREICDNAQDDTLDGKVDCEDPDCTYHEACRENCSNGIDDTGDGKMDCKDPGCSKHAGCIETCDNQQDDNGDGKVDCDDPLCDMSLDCAAEGKGRLDLFVMSMCPYAGKAEEALLEVTAKLGKHLKLEIHFITTALDGYGYHDYKRKSWCHKYPDGLWYCSMHGKEETEENLRQICVQALYPGKKKLLEYIVCRNQDPENPDWDACAEQAGLKPKKIDKCATGKKGLKLLKADSDLSSATGITKSPTYLWKGKYLDHVPHNAEAITEKFCSMNPTVPPCKKLASTD